MLAKAKRLAADVVVMDLEDAVAPSAKPSARRNVVAALNGGGFGQQIRAVRVNAWTSPWTYLDLVEVVGEAGSGVDTIVLPKVESAHHVVALDLLLTQIEQSAGLTIGRIGIEALIESARGVVEIDSIVTASPRLETLIFGPADFIASTNMRTRLVGEQPPGYDVGDAYHYPLMRTLIAARAHGKQAIAGPYLAIGDSDGCRRVARQSAALGFDGTWVVHPDQIAVANDVFSPSQEDYDRAELILETYAHSTGAAGGARGAVMLGEEMIDAASRRMALVVVGKGRAAGMIRLSVLTGPEA